MQKKRVLFVCLGNICRSPMAEFIFRKAAEREGLADMFETASAGTSAEEEGSLFLYIYAPYQRLPRVRARRRRAIPSILPQKRNLPVTVSHARASAPER